MTSPYRIAPSPPKALPRPLSEAPVASWWRKIQAWKQGIGQRWAIRAARHAITRGYPCATWKTRQRLAIRETVKLHTDFHGEPHYLRVECDREHRFYALEWARRDADGLIDYYRRICATVRPPTATDLANDKPPRLRPR